MSTTRLTGPCSSWLIALAALCSAGCADGGSGDSGPDPPTWNLVDPVPEGEVRAGAITDPASLLPGPDAVGQVGDYKIYNARAAFVIQGPHRTHGWTGSGGSLLDAAPVVGGVSGEDHLQEIVPLAGTIRIQDADTVTVVNDGRDGAAAVVRVSGPDRGIPMADLGLPLPAATLGARLTTEYRLAPDVPYLEIVTTVRNLGTERLRTSVGEMIMPGDQTRTFAPGTGFGGGFAGADLTFWTAVGETTSYAFLAEGESTWTVLLTLAEALPLYVDKISLLAGAEESYRWHLVVGTGDVDSLRTGIRSVAPADAAPVFPLTGLVAAGDDLTNVEVLVLGGPELPLDAAYSHTRVRPNGSFSLALPDGDYQLQAQGPGRAEAAVTSVTVAGGAVSDVALPLGPPAWLQYTVTAADGRPSPCRLQLQAGHGAAPTDRVVDHRVSASGTDTTPLLPGEYTVTVSRGFEYALDRQDVTLVAGETATLDAVLTRVVDTSGYLATDHHNHASPSPDSTQSREQKVASLVGDGLELAQTMTDHDAITDLGATVEALGVTDLFIPVMGIEISPPYGHSCALRVAPFDDTPQDHPFPWVEYDAQGVFSRVVFPPETWSQARAMGARVIQVNHPRSYDAYFDFVGLDAVTGEVSRPEAWSTEFDAIELFNGLDSASHVLNLTLPDWYGFLNRGENHVATGNSDQHENDHQAGNVRTYVALEDDDPATCEPCVVFDNLLAFRALVSSGPFLRFTIDGQDIGATVVPAGASVTATVEVQAPSFVPVRWVRIVGNGEVVVDEACADTGVVRCTHTFELTPAVDTWYHALAGDEALSPRPLHGRGSLAFTNPIWVDLGGDGFTPPR